MRMLLWCGAAVTLAAVAVGFYANRCLRSSGEASTCGCCAEVAGAAACTDETPACVNPPSDLPPAVVSEPQPAVAAEPPVRTLGKIVIQNPDEPSENPVEAAPLVKGVAAEEAAEVPATMPRVGEAGGVPVLMPRVEDGGASMSEWLDKAVEKGLVAPPAAPAYRHEGYCPYSGKCVTDTPARMPRVEDEPTTKKR